MLVIGSGHFAADQLRIHSSECVDCEPVRLTDDPSLTQQLRRSKLSPMTMAAIRGLVLTFSLPVHKSSDDQVLNEFRRLLASGFIRVCRRKAAQPMPVASPGEQKAPASAGPAFPLSESKPVRKSAPQSFVEPDTFEDALDGAAIAAVLKSAAADGTPFCEECERARAARA